MSASPTAKRFVADIAAGVRLRHHIEIYKGVVTHFAVTLEHQVESQWYRVVRYDTTGGRAHRDRLLPDGSYLAHREKVGLSEDFSEALKAARRDLTKNYQNYVRLFRKSFSE